MVSMRGVTRKPVRSKYAGPWASPYEASRVLGVHPGDLEQARERGIIREGVHYRVISTGRRCRRVFVYDLPRLRQEWAEIAPRLRRSYMLGRQRYVPPDSGQPAGQSMPALHAIRVLTKQPPMRATPKSEPKSPEQPQTDHRKPRYEAERPFCGPPLPSLGDSDGDGYVGLQLPQKRRTRNGNEGLTNFCFAVVIRHGARGQNNNRGSRSQARA
jgi:hypothetical protein